MPGSALSPALSRRDLLGSVALAAAPPARRPNVLFIMPDQLRAQSVGCYGNTDVRTPNLDRLAGEGMLFEEAFANTPVCCPARANILTGKYAHRNGMMANDLRLRESEPTVGELFRSAGYRTGFIGKWHLDGGPRMPGFIPPGPRRHGFEFWAANECSHEHFRNQYFRDSPEPIPLGKFETEGWTDIAIEFLRESSRESRPFFLTVQMGPPHDPYKAPPEYRRLFDPAKLTMRPNWREAKGLPGPPEIAEYYGMIASIDDQVGRALNALERFGLARDTIVLFSSDHGDMLGSQGQRLKRKPWEESIRVPCMLRFPGRVRPGVRVRGMFTHVDFAPTLSALCGIRVPRAMQGADCSRFVLGRGSRLPDSAFFQIFGPYDGDGTTRGWRGVRTARHMYARYETGPWVLYDLERDPAELQNLAAEPSAENLRRDLDGKLANWMRRTGDSWSLDWHEMVEDKGRLYKDRAFYTVDEYVRWSRAKTE
jgi:arylsulfatase A-like enzyme